MKTAFIGRLSKVLQLLGAVLAITAAPQSGVAQTAPLQSFDMPLSIDSGLLFNTESEPMLLWTETVYVPGAEWVRLRFNVALLGEGLQYPEGSVLRITSLTDGAVQLLNARTVREWQNTSAYFNGPAVLLELFAAPNGMPNRIVIMEATGGLPGDSGVNVQSICGNTDDRVLSYDPRACRIVPVGCTGWIIDDVNRTLFTAGHCASGTGLQVVQFNVPLSNPDGSINHPPPSDQYAVDPTSVQYQDGGVGNDWCYFGAYTNSTTGLTPYEAQGAYFTLAMPPPVQSQSIRITGYGTVSSPVDRRWNQVQKTHVGPYMLRSGTRLGYATDTTGGNSGSPVINENTGEAIGIHTHGGCTATGGYNNGTGYNHSNLQNALANPRGVCASGLAFSYPDGRPTVVSPLGGTTMRVVVQREYGNTPKPGTGILHYDLGSGFVAVPMSETAPNQYLAQFPPAPCGTLIRYFVSAESTGGRVFSDPKGAPAKAYAVYAADSVVTVFEDDFEMHKGWTVVNSSGLTAGAWERAIPNGGGARGDPLNDYDGSGHCYVTQNGPGDTDVDNGSTYLISPPINLAGTDGIVSYARWFHNSFGANPFEDVFDVHVSNDNGATWVLAERVGPTGSQVSGGWFTHQFTVSDFVAPTATVRVRFTASDLGGGSVVEGGVDAFRVVAIQCAPENSLSGQIALEYLEGSPDGLPVTVEFRDPGTTTIVASYVVVLDHLGRYSISSVPGGVFDLAAKGGSWLRQVLANRNVAGATVADFALRNGDANGDNAVNVLDMTLVLSNFGTSGGAADVTRNGAVNITDLNVVLTNFGKVGAP